MKIFNKQKERIVNYWKGFTINQQISILIFFIIFTIFMKFGKLFYSSIEVMKIKDLKIQPFILLLVVLIAWIINIIISQVAYFLDKLSSERVAHGLNYAFIGFSLFFIFSLPFVSIVQMKDTPNMFIWFMLIIIGLSFSAGVAYTWYGIINLIKSLIKWLTTDEEKMKVDQKNTLVLTFLGVIISMIALFK